MRNKSIIIVPGEQQSVFLKFFKSLKSNKFKDPLILISSIKILKTHMKKNNFKRIIRSINLRT